MNNSIQLLEKINTNRLYLRKFLESDWNDMYEYITDPEVMKYEPYLSEEDHYKWFTDHITCNNFWAVCLADSSKVIGDIYMGKGEKEQWEVGYMFNAHYQKLGYATEAVSAIISHTFQIEGAHKIYAFCNPENIASWKLLERLGFCREGNIRENAAFRKDPNGNPIWVDTFLYGILKSEWVKYNILLQ